MFLRSSVWSRIPTLRMASVTRISLDRLLASHFARLKKGHVLDVGAKGAPYIRQIPHTQYLRLDITEEQSRTSVATSIHSSGSPIRSIRSLQSRFLNTCTIRNGLSIESSLC